VLALGAVAVGDGAAEDAGEQTWEEMVFGVIRYRNVKEDGKPKDSNQSELFSGSAGR
jgi:hypothetical protein